MSEGSLQEVVLVEIGGGLFAFAASCVREVLPLVEPIPMPEWPEHAFGLVEVRGQMVPLIDVAPTLGRPSSAPTPRHFMLTLTANERLWAILVDRVEGVVSASVRAPEGAAEAFSMCRGLVQTAQGAVVLVDPDVMTRAVRLPRYGNSVPTVRR